MDAASSAIPPSDARHHIFVVSDATGQTAETVTLAALSQFQKEHAVISKIRNVRTEAQVLRVIQEVAQVRGLLIYTLVSERLRDIVQSEAQKHGVITVDLIGPLLSSLTAFMGTPPQAKPGLIHQIDELYFQRIEAIDFSVKHDDGQNHRTIGEADIILVGVSRTTKTPLSIYLAKESYKVANVPIVLNIQPPAELFSIKEKKIVGLIIDPGKLANIRRDRLRHLGEDTGNPYADMGYISEELNFAKDMFRKNGWPMVNVTNRAVEEVANDILSRIFGADRKA
jgi:regulator of PEP synthase PpsR (kinase-PPPase family)